MLKLANLSASLIFFSLFSNFTLANEINLQCGPIQGATVDWNSKKDIAVAEEDGFSGRTIRFSYKMDHKYAEVTRKDGLSDNFVTDHAKLISSNKSDKYLRMLFTSDHIGVDRIFTLFFRESDYKPFLSMTENQVAFLMSEPQTRTFLMPCVPF
ncbi:hypothetical protein [Sinorhizobium meliloti]|uniref:hypothetical protein n=1 Tax=Rhizobium meliloti TaxID=382 RepID=UPI000FD88572|nr:hypothetical protein [Sinorhizobium meliloti]RVQ55876.1 hypothetical protein CN245_16105 [Sinorhizobium meliloti]